MDGLHLTADLRDCAPHRPAMTDVAALRTLCLRAVAHAGLQPVGELFHRFPDAEPPGVRSNEAGGITGVVLLAESHLAVHTWPELGAVTLDVYVCNHGADNTARAHVLLAQLLDGFGAAQVERHELLRGAARLRAQR
jgi:S-adenosylmethionine decarboxylase